MKRDMELVRSLLLKIEQADKPNFSDLLDENASMEERRQVLYHLSLLIDDAELVKGFPAHSTGKQDWLKLDLTWDGHELLDSIKNDIVWNKVKEKAQGAGIFAFGVLKELGISYAKERLGLSG